MQATAGQRSIQIRMKAISSAGRSLIIYAAAGIFGLACVKGQAPAENPAEHEREELGINPYTAPSVAEIFQQLDDLKPLPGRWYSCFQPLRHRSLGREASRRG